MTEPSAPQPESRTQRAPDARRWMWPAALAALIIVPVIVLIMSNLEATEVSWAGFRFNQPLWVVLVVTFLAGMLGSKVTGWGWRRWRKRRRRLKEELEILRKHGADADNASD